MQNQQQDGSIEMLLEQVLGYLNLSAGAPDPRFQQNLCAVFAHLQADSADRTPCWRRLYMQLVARLDQSRDSSPAFRSTDQVDAVLPLVFDELLPAYLKHHRDLLFHQTEPTLFNALFVARACEAVLAEQGPWRETERIVSDALGQLNDFLGHRPVAVLHNDRKAEPYLHERVRPVPLYLRGVGVAPGPYHDLIAAALERLSACDPELRDEAYLDLELLEELALDPRAYDFGHPANRRPNYQFGEWDPHLIDNVGRYRRFVVRQVTLDALLDRVRTADTIPEDERMREAAGVLAGVILMAAGTSGRGPETHDSSATLATLLPKIAKYRDRFYQDLVARLPEPHRTRIQAEAERTRQPLGGARQHLNRYLARLRAAQLQHIELAKQFAEMGYPAASQRQAQVIPVVRGRMLSEISSRVTSSHHYLDTGRLNEASALLTEMEDLLHRAIECGAFVDPWNILAFQGQFSIFAARENSVHDQRVDELTDLMEDLFTLYVRLSSEAAASGEPALGQVMANRLEKLAHWWDQFATMQISGIRGISGRESWESAQHVAAALGAWHKDGRAAGDLAFWRGHVEKFQSPKSYSLVIEALLAKRDYVAAMALLLQWMGQAERVPLQDGQFSFHTLAVRWMQGCDFHAAVIRPTHPWPLVRKFFDYLESNAEAFWDVPRLDARKRRGRSDSPQGADDWPDSEEHDLDNPFEAAYEGMTYRDSTSDGTDGGTISDDGGQLTDEELLYQSERISVRLRFLTTLASLWRTAVGRQLPYDSSLTLRASIGLADSAGGREAGSGVLEMAECDESLRTWLTRARANQQALMHLLEALAARSIPLGPGAQTSLVDYDRYRRMKDALALEVLLAYVATGRAALGILAALPAAAADATSEPELGQWQRQVVDLQRLILRGDVTQVRAALPGVFRALSRQPLLYVPLGKRGDPQQVAAAQILQQVLRDLLRALPRLGCLSETYHLIETVRTMEKQLPVGPRAVSEFDRLFQIGFQATVEHLVLSSETWRPPALDAERAREAAEHDLIDSLHTITESLLRQWRHHSQSLRLSVLEKIADEPHWQRLVTFIKNYGGMFGQKFLSNQGNLRSILHQGVNAYLQALIDNRDPHEEVRLLDDLGGSLDRNEAVANLELILEAVLENYAEYKDFNSTTTQSDNGENLYMLLDFLRLKASYERTAWHLTPVVLAHEVLVRHRCHAAAERWRQVLATNTAPAAQWHLRRLEQLQQTYSMHLPTVSDRLREEFVRPLALDRIRALVRPAVKEAGTGLPSPAFEMLEQEILAFSEQPTGVGLDVPQWLVALEVEVQQARAPVHIDSLSTEWLPLVPLVTLTQDQLHEQLRIWEEPLAGN